MSSVVASRRPQRPVTDSVGRLGLGKEGTLGGKGCYLTRADDLMTDALTLGHLRDGGSDTGHPKREDHDCKSSDQ